MMMSNDYRQMLSAADSLEELGAAISQLALDGVGCDFAMLYGEGFPLSPHALPLLLLSGEVQIQKNTIAVPMILNDVGRARIDRQVREVLEELSICSVALLPIYHGGTLRAIMEVRFEKRYHRFRKEDELLLQTLAEWCAIHIARLGSRPERSATDIDKATPHPDFNQRQLHDQFQRLARYGNIVVIRTDAALAVMEVAGETERVTGLSSGELLNQSDIWGRIVHPIDQRRLAAKLRRAKIGELNEEIRIINQKTGKHHWVLLRALPHYSAQGELRGWEGFGVDVSDLRDAQEKLKFQGRRIAALYEVAASLKLNMDPALVALRGLRALVQATDSDCGFIGLVDSGSSSLEVVASEGLSATYIEAINARINANTLARMAVDRKEGFLIADIQNDPRAAVDIATKEGLRSTIIVPLQFEQLVLGVIVLFCREAGRYTSDDLDLVSAASSQIALAARQAELYLSEKYQASSLAALYRLSHELSKQLSLKQVAEHAFPVIQEELACKRIWLGVMNERGTHIAGIAGFGPGVRQHIIDVQIELNLRHDFLDQALKKKQAIVVEAGQSMECSGLNRIMRRLEVGTLIIVPLVALGQVMGVLVVEPSISSPLFAQRKLPLLTSMAGEIATVVMARRFEARMAAADKMRMAGLLASGISHNFNNLLQAVMGQASLIEMQAPADSRITQSSRMIIESASRGANLVKQLFSFSAPGPLSPQSLNINQVLLDSQDLYRSALGTQIVLEYSLAKDAPEVVVDYSQVQQVLTNLLVNAHDALRQNKEGKVRISSRKVRLRSGEIDPELAPGVYLRIDVEDNGAGMDKEQQARCFEPFFTTKNVDSRTGLGFDGAGLGLSTAYSIMKQHDGLILVRSQLGHGTVFSLFFPAVVVKAGEAEKTVREEVDQRPMVLTYGLDEATMTSVRTAIEGSELRLYALGQPERFVQEIEEQQEKIRLMVIDLDVLGLGRRSFFERLVQLKPAPLVLGICADRLQWTEAVRMYEFVRVSEKPLGPWVMSSSLREMLGRVSSSSLESQVEKISEDSSNSATPKSTTADVEAREEEN